MKRNYSFTDAKVVMEQLNSMYNEIFNMHKLESTYLQEVKGLADRYINRQLISLLKKVSVDELNRDKKGIRVKVLHENGYNTYADLLTISEKRLAALNGISMDVAMDIKNDVTEMRNILRNSVNLKISVDNKTSEITQLLIYIEKYIESQNITKKASYLIDIYNNNVIPAEKALNETLGTFNWLFKSNVKKENSVRAYNYLNGLLSGEYKEQIEQLHFENNNVSNVNSQFVWEKFEKNPIIYINIIEKISPNLLGEQDQLFGLPEELANSVNEEKFSQDGLLCNLRRYQEWGVKYILHQGNVLLGDEMGLGKTIQAIAVMVALHKTGGTHFVVVCPASVLINWEREIKKYSKLNVIIVHGYGREKELENWIQSGGVAITTYETTGYFNLQAEFKFSLLTVDEAHYIKNPDAYRTINTKKLCEHADRLLFMTGTALENNVEEMIRLIRILRPSIADEIQNMKALSFAPQFREKIAPVYYRRKREDVLKELPDLLENEEWCQLNCEEEKTYEYEVINKNFHAARRVSWNIDNIKNSSKAKRMLELIDEAKSEGRKVIVFSFYLDTISKIISLLGDKCMGPINGSLSPAGRQEIIDKFEQATAGTVLVSQIMAGGTGLNIQSASVVIICEPQLKPSTENQAISRAYRMGQARNVLVYRLLCENTIDERIMDRLAQKQQVFDGFADESVAAKKLEIEIDSKTMNDIFEEELNRINKKS